MVVLFDLIYDRTADSPLVAIHQMAGLKLIPISNDTRTTTYDAASRITNTTDTNPIYNRSFDYDVNNRLTRQLDKADFENRLL